MNLNLALRRRAHSQHPRLIPFGVAMQVLLADARRHQHCTGQAGRAPNTSGYQTTVPWDEAVVSEVGDRVMHQRPWPKYASVALLKAARLV